MLLQGSEAAPRNPITVMPSFWALVCESTGTAGGGDVWVLSVLQPPRNKNLKLFHTDQTGKPKKFEARSEQ